MRCVNLQGTLATCNRGGQYILRDEKILFLHIAECGVSGKRAQDCQ